MMKIDHFTKPLRGGYNRLFSFFEFIPLVKSKLLFTSLLVCCTHLLSAHESADPIPFFSGDTGGATAVLSGGGDLCFNGPGDSLTVTFTGTGPFTFVYSIAGVPQAPITTSQMVYKIFVNPVMYTKYQLVSLTAQGMPGTVSGMAEIFVYVSSNASLGADLTFCNGVSTTLLANLTGTAPFTLTYSVNGVVQPSITAPEGPISIPANVTETSVYKLISIESPGCVQPETDSQTIFINYAPSFANLNFNCNLVAGTYTVSFNVVGGTAPYTLITGNGNFTGNQFVSQPIPIANNYNIIFRDVNNCGNAVVTGPNTCNCTTNAGTVVTTPIQLCGPAVASTVHQQNQVLDGNDILRFILHTQPSIPLGQILAWNTTPDFAFTGGLQTGVTYYISAIAGNDAGNGQVDLTDVCLSVSPGAPVVWRALPSLSLGPDVEICPGGTYDIQVQFTGVAPFLVEYTVDTFSFTESNLFPPYSFTGTTDTDLLYHITAVGDQYCMVNTSDTILVNVHQAPQTNTPFITCNQAQGTYSIIFTVVSDDVSSVSLSGLTGNYNFLTGMFVSDPIPEANPFMVTITDQYQCGTDTVSGISNCQCITESGVLPGDTIKLCYGLPVNFQPALGSSLGPNDTLIYVLATNTDPAFWTIRAQSGTPSIPFPSGPVIPGAIYYVVALVGEKTATGVLMTDPCLSFSNAIPVVWRNTLTAAVSGNNTICAGATTPILIQLAGGTGYTYDIFANNTLFQSVSNTNGSLAFYNVTPTETTVYEVRNLVAGGCAGTGVTQATVTVNPVPEIVGLQQICDGDNLHYTLQFGISNGPGFNTTYTVTGITGTFITDTVFVSDSYTAATPYTITVSSPSGCSSTISGSGTCECATDAGTLTPLAPEVCLDGMVTATFNNDAVLDNNDGLVYFICDDPAQIPQSILATSNTPAFGFLPGMTAGTTYFMFVAAGNILPDGSLDYSDACTSLSGGVSVSFHEAPSVVMIPVDTTICVGQNFQIPLTLNGTPPFKLVYSLNGIQLPEITTNLPAFVISSSNIQSDQVFELVSVTDAHCSGAATGTATIHIKERPVLTLSGADTICPGQSVTLLLKLENADAATVEILSSTGPSLAFSDITGDFTFTIPDVTTTTTYSIGNVVFTGNDCPGLIQGVGKVVVAPVTVQSQVSNYNGFGVSCHDAMDGSIALQTTGGGGQYTYTWENGASGATLPAVTPGDYAYTVTDQTGCSSNGVVTVTQPEQLRFQTSVILPHCPGDDDGSIVLESITGGVPAYNLEVDQTVGVPVFTLPQTISSLTAGSYTIQVTDANGCTVVESTIVNDPLPVLVSLGDDQVLYLGDSLWLTATVNTSDIQTYSWSPSQLLAPSDSSSAFIVPVRTSAYQVTVTNSEGCTASDEVVIMVKRDDGIFVPNVITPESGDQNSVLTFFGGKEILYIQYLRIYDRWGELMFENTDFLPNDISQGWDGRWRNKLVQPGVYYYVAEVVKYGGITSVVKGDCTVLR